VRRRAVGFDLNVKNGLFIHDYTLLTRIAMY